jgi:hypothetical protein
MNDEIEFVFFDSEMMGCGNCGKNVKTYCIGPYYDQKMPYCKSCWAFKMASMCNGYLKCLLMEANKEIKVGNITQTYDKYTLPPSIDKSNF